MKDPRQDPITAYLDVSPDYLAADPAELFSICNGCGSAQAKFDFVPDSIWRLSIKPACFPHDWEYHHGKTLQDKRKADMRFLSNMLTIIDRSSANRFMKLIRNHRAYKYYDAVSLGGDNAFWAGKIRRVSVV